MSGRLLPPWPVPSVRVDALWEAPIEAEVWLSLSEKYVALEELAEVYDARASRPQRGPYNDTSIAIDVLAPATKLKMRAIAARWPGALREAELVPPDQLSLRRRATQSLMTATRSSIAILVAAGVREGHEAAAAACTWALHCILLMRAHSVRASQAGSEAGPQHVAQQGSRAIAFSERCDDEVPLRPERVFADRVRALSRHDWVALTTNPQTTGAPIAVGSQLQLSNLTSRTRGAHLVLAAELGLRIRPLLSWIYVREGRWLEHPQDPPWASQAEGQAELRFASAAARSHAEPMS